MSSTAPFPKYHRIELALAERIRDGTYGSTALPGERELAQEFGAARVTIRTALRRLQDQGLVVRLQRQGTLSSPLGRAGRPHRACCVNTSTPSWIAAAGTSGACCVSA